MTDPKPILFIVDGSIAVTGALVSAARQAKLLKDEVETVLVLPRRHQVPSSLTTAFAEVIELPIVNLRKSAVSLIIYGPALVAASIMLWRAMRRLGCERLQFNDFYLAHGALLRLFGFHGRIVTFVRIDPTRFGTVGRIWLAAARWCSTELVAVSRFIQTMLGPDTPSRLVYEQTSVGPDPYDRTTRSPRMLFVGNYIEGKGQNYAVEAFNRIADLYPAGQLRFVGGDMGLDKNRQFRERLQRAAAVGPAPERIEFRGHTDDLTVDYADAFAALNFSVSESFSITCLDASAAGLPVVATRCGGPEEILDEGTTGFLVPIADVAAMAERMAWLFDHPDAAAAMGKAGQRLVEKRFAPERSKSALMTSLGLAPAGRLR